MTDAAQTDDRPEWRALYDEAWEKFRLIALWSYRKVEAPTPASALAICHSLRFQGNMASRILAERLERACHAAH